MAFITELPDSGLTDPMAGTAGIELFVDEKSIGRRSVDRLPNQSFLVDLTQAKELKVVVDCANENENGIIFILGSHKNPKRNKAFSRLVVFRQSTHDESASWRDKRWGKETR